MKTRLIAVAGAVAAAMIAVSAAGAQCASAAGWQALAKPATWTATHNGARLLRTAYWQDDQGNGFPSIVGMWHVHLVSQTVSGATGVPLPPLGVEIDAGFQQWHSDGTEMLNSGRPAANTNFCMGVWEQVGPRTYKLNHFALSYTQGPPANPGEGPTNTFVGPTSITETVTVSPDGKTFTGTFTISDYKETDPPNSAAPTIVWQDTIKGLISATRVTVNPPISPNF